ncbi:glutamate--cysteine ligase [Aestuariispira insulae]|uniref:Glutamate--cysteine ligase n=1 Tax=Aestuariispira insulae TaxID=1461337 RepID=A0A3D9H9I4_9PROT|nr:glutamate--cysteine ligase [Aestuariispira insulae]RED46153.1 glutamate--cysteine ligase [Aestuariispira insulae]
MAAASSKDQELITSKDQLIHSLAKGCKPKDQWRIGTEHEKFVYDLNNHKRLPYFDTPGIKALLEAIGEGAGWEPVMEGEHIIALKCGETGASISLEPGGQFELSGAPLETIHQTCSEVNRHLKLTKEICDNMGAGMIGLGFDPQWARDDITWMPKGRYKIMREYMPKKGSMGLDMMIRTCTVQVNLDFDSEADMIRKMRVSVALQPIATALFANSPFKEGKLSGLKSLRSHVWTDTDPDRCGMLPFVFDEGFGFERWVDYMLDVPMYFIHRGNDYLDVSGKSFRSYMKGELAGFEGQIPTMTDWEDHLTTAFPEVRLKSFIEMRGADGGPWRNLCALPAFWVGLLYDSQALNEAEALIADWTVEEMAKLRDDAPAKALDAEIRGRTIREISREILEIARGGLKRRGKLNSDGDTEEHFLNPLQDIVETGRTNADELIEIYEKEWMGDISRIYDAFSY